MANKYELEDIVNDFGVFYKYMFEHINLPEPTEAQLEMAKFVGDGNGDKMLLALRGLAKSLTTQLYVLWRLLRNQNEHILVLSASSKRSRNFTNYLLSMMKSVPLLQHLYPKGSQRRASDHFDVNGSEPSDSPNVYSAGIGTGLAGFRATMVISDDIETPQNSRTPESRETLIHFFNEATNLLFAKDGKSGEVIILGTYQSLDSIYKRLENNGYNVFIIPAEYPMHDSKYGKRIAPYIAERLRMFPELRGKAVDTRFNDDILKQRRLKIGKSAYALQYLLDPTDSDELKYPLKLHDLIVTDIDSEEMPLKFYYDSDNKINMTHHGFSQDFMCTPNVAKDMDRSPFEFTIMSIDPSGRGADKTGYAVVSLLNGKIFLRAFGATDGGYHSTALTGLSLIAKEYGANRVVIESNFGDGAFTELFKPILSNVGHPCEVEESRATTMKEARIIETLEPIVNQHRLIVDRGALLKDANVRSEHSFTYQYTHITKERNSLSHDDVLDATELAVSQLIEYMATNEDSAINQIREEEIIKANEIIHHIWNDIYSPSSNFGTRY